MSSNKIHARDLLNFARVGRRANLQKIRSSKKSLMRLQIPGKKLPLGHFGVLDKLFALQTPQFPVAFDVGSIKSRIQIQFESEKN
jgi:hypothetical protein